jgi:CO/xanthine dehydrogenase FAD-binding subunit
VATADVPELGAITWMPDGALEIGGAVTLARLAREVRDAAPMVAAAVDQIASPQIREVATVAGNLVQHKRCWFFRNGFQCYKRRGALAPCYAVLGDHRFYHAALGAHRCQAVTPSDLATALIAFDAEVLIEGASPRSVPLDDFYAGPGETVLGDGEVVRAVRMPARALARTAAFEKLGLWEGDFAVVSAAVAARVDARGAWHDVRVVLGALAPTPWRARATERFAEGRTVTADEIQRALDRELDAHGHPLPGNAWKLDAAGGLVRRAAERMRSRP